MDSRDMLIIGAVAVAAFLYYRSHTGSVSVTLPAGQAGAVGAAAMTSSGAATTTGPFRAPVTSQVGLGLSSPFGGFSAINMGGLRFAGSTATAVVSDAIAPAPVRRAPVVSTPTFVGGAGVYPVGASSMGPQPQLTAIVNAGNKLNLTRY